jgi:hypothetical protein
MRQIVPVPGVAGDLAEPAPIFTSQRRPAIPTSQGPAHPVGCVVCGNPGVEVRCQSCMPIILFGGRTTPDPGSACAPVPDAVAALYVRINPISNADRAAHSIPRTETFAVTLSTGEVVATDEDVPRGVNPEKYARRIAANRGADYIGCGGLLFVLNDRGWTSDYEDQDDGDIHNPHADLLPVIYVAAARQAVA